MTKPDSSVEETQSQASKACSTNGSKGSCTTVGCGGPGLCPGVALLIAYVTGSGIALLTGTTWLGWMVGIPTALFLLTGAWRFFPRHSRE